MNSDRSRVVFILLDGARHDVLRGLLARGDLPNLARWVVEPGGFAVGTTVFPSTTGVAYVPFLFGRYPANLGIPGIRWLDRPEAAGDWRAQWRAARSYCGVQGGWLNHDILGGRSVFEIVPESVAICTSLKRGLRDGALRIPARRALLGGLAHYTGRYEALDARAADAWVAAADEPWRFLFVVFPGADGITHWTAPDHPRVLESYRAVDRALGRFVERARRRGELPALFVAADHGASSIHEHCDVAVLLEGWGVPTLRHPMHVWRGGARAAVMVSGNACAHVYFAPRSGRAAALAEGELPAELVERLVTLPAVQLAAWRAKDGGVVVARNHERARVSAEGSAIHYEPRTGDPLGLGSAALRLGDRELLTRSRGTGLPDAPRQLLDLLASPRSGDLVLAARLGSDLRGRWEIPEHKSGHGSLIAQHMEVPIATSVPLPGTPIRTVDLMPTMLEVLGLAVPDGLDGVPFSRLARLALSPP